MNDNHLIVCEQRIAIGPMLAHMMLSNQELQDRLLGLDKNIHDIPEMHFPVAETGGVITFEYQNIAGFSLLTVCYIDDTYTATFEHVGGDSIETLEMSFEDDDELAEWLEDALESSRSGGHPITLPFDNRFGELLRVNVSDIEANPTEDAQWVARGDTWASYYDAGLQREEEASRKAA